MDIATMRRKTFPVPIEKEEITAEEEPEYKQQRKEALLKISKTC